MTWPTKKLGDICDVIGGGTPSKLNFNFYEGNIPWATVRDMKSEFIKNTEFRISQEAVRKSSTNIIPKNNVVIATRVGLGKVCFLKNDTAINQDLRGIIPKKASALSVNYLFWWLKSISNVIIQNGTGATVHGVKLPFIKNLQIPLPPLPTQRRIVKLLDEIFEKASKAKENAEKNLKNSKELFESYLQSVFAKPGEGWEYCLLNDYVKFIDYRGRTPQKTETGLRLITAKNIKMGFLRKTPEEFIDPKDYDAWMTRGIPKKGDVLFTTEAPLGNVAQLDTDEKVAFAQRTIIFQPDINKLDQTFLKYLLISSPIQKKIIEKETGATVKGIKARLLKKGN